METYRALSDAAIRYAKTKGEYDSRLSEIKTLYETVQGADVEGELVADLVGDYLFTDEDFIKSLSYETNVFKRIFDEIKYLCKTAIAGSKEARELEKVKRAFERAYRENAIEGDSVKFMLTGVDENGIEIYETTEDTKSMSYKERKEKLLDFMKKEFAGRTAKFERNGKVYYAFCNERGIRKGVYGDNKSSNKGYKTKINIGADGNYVELAKNSFYVRSSNEKGKQGRFHSDAESWDYYAKTIMSDGDLYDVLVNIKDTGDAQYVYDITLKETDSLPNPRRLKDGSSTVSNNRVPQKTKMQAEILKIIQIQKK